MLMPTLPDVSFVVTFYNKKDFVFDVLNAMQNQRGLGQTEYVIVDDGSTDGTLQLLQDFAQKTPNAVLIAQKNQGPAVALNNGVAAARYPYIKPIEGDDILHPDATHRLWQVLFDKNAVATYLCPSTFWFYIHGNKIDPDKILETNPATRHLTLKNHLKFGVGNGSMLFCTREAFLAVGGSDERVFVQDNTINTRLALRGETYQVLLDDAIAFPPAVQGERISASSAQLTHDDMAALYYLFQDHPQISLSLRHKMVRHKSKHFVKWLNQLGNADFKDIVVHVFLSWRSYVLPLNEKFLMDCTKIIRRYRPNVRVC